MSGCSQKKSILQLGMALSTGAKEYVIYMQRRPSTLNLISFENLCAVGSGPYGFNPFYITHEWLRSYEPYKIHRIWFPVKIRISLAE